MPNLDFYAASEDYDPILDFVFSAKKFRVFESYSRPDHELVELKSVERMEPLFEAQVLTYLKISGEGWTSD